MLGYSIQDGLLTLRVQVVPRASRSEAVGEHNGLLRIRIAAPPVEGAANKELIRVLAKMFKVSRGSIEIISGHGCRVKQVRIAGAAPAIVESFSKGKLT
jgi:uncharacterized protein (TIGR00251 family)